MPRHNRIKACEDFHRTVDGELHREIGISRRRFISLGIGAGLTLYTARSLPLQHWMEGAEAASAQAPEAPVLVSVFLPGGLDLLDSLVPLNQYGSYRDARGLNAQPETASRLGSTGLGVHPSLEKGPGGGIRGLFERGRIGFLPGIDYANPDLSHFHSRHFWETGIITASATTGWLGRWLDAHGSQDNPFQGLSSSYRLSPTLISAGAPVCSVENVRAAELPMPGVSGPGFERAMTAWSELAYPRSKDGPGRASVRRSARLAREVADKLRPLAASAPEPQTQGGDLAVPLVGGQADGGYPRTAFGDRLRQLAFMLAQPLGVRIATVDATGDFDTHHAQGPTLTRALADVSTALSAFQADIEARGAGDRVLTFVWSEFGRRPKGNTSGGTDHGAGGIAWVQGNRAASGILAEYPDLRSLDDKGNLKVTIDFRQVYASLVEQWLGTDAAGVVPDAAAFGRVGVVR